VGKTRHFQANINTPKTAGDTPKLTINVQYEVAYALSINIKIDDLG